MTFSFWLPFLLLSRPFSCANSNIFSNLKHDDFFLREGYYVHEDFLNADSFSDPMSFELLASTARPDTSPTSKISSPALNGSSSNGIRPLPGSSRTLSASSTLQQSTSVRSFPMNTKIIPPLSSLPLRCFPSASASAPATCSLQKFSPMAHLNTFEANLRNLVDWERFEVESGSACKDSVTLAIPEARKPNDESFELDKDSSSGSWNPRSKKRKSCATQVNPLKLQYKSKAEDGDGDGEGNYNRTPFKYLVKCCDLEYKYVAFAIRHVVSCQADVNLAVIEDKNQKTEKFIERIDYLGHEEEFVHVCEHCPYRCNNPGNMATHRGNYH